MSLTPPLVNLSALQTRTLDALGVSDARNRDRYLGSVAGLAATVQAHGHPAPAKVVKELENTFAAFHEAILGQAGRLIAGHIAMLDDASLPATAPICDATFDAARDYAEATASAVWKEQVVTAFSQMTATNKADPQAVMSSLQARVRYRNQAAEIWRRKEMFDAVAALINLHEMRRATAAMAEAARTTKTLTLAMVGLTAVIALGTAIQSLGNDNAVANLMKLIGH